MAAETWAPAGGLEAEDLDDGGEAEDENTGREPGEDELAPPQPNPQIGRASSLENVPSAVILDGGFPVGAPSYGTPGRNYDASPFGRRISWMEAPPFSTRLRRRTPTGSSVPRFTTRKTSGRRRVSLIQ